MQAAEQREQAGPAGGSVLLRHIRAQAARRAEVLAQTPVLAAAPPPPPARSVDRALASAIGRAADRAHGLPLFFDRVETGHAILAELNEILPEGALLSVVEGPGDSLGVVAICPGLLTSLIEIQAVGRISARPAAVRRPTRTDGAVCAEFVNACLAEMAAEVAGHAGFQGFGHYRYASFIEDARPLELMLDDVAYRRIDLSLRAGPAGQRDGRLVVLLPVAPAPAALPDAGRGTRPVVETAGAAPADPGTAEAPTAQSGGMPARGDLADAVAAVPISLYGILCRRTISLGELRRLQPGTLVSLPPDALSSATLETPSGQRLFGGRLGELGGRHALRLLGSDPGRAPGLGRAGQEDADAAGSEGAGGPFPMEGLSAHPDATNGATGAVPDAGTFGAGILEPPLDDLSVPDPFRDGAAGWPQSETAPAAEDPGFAVADLSGGLADLSAWEDGPAEDAAIPLRIG